MKVQPRWDANPQSMDPASSVFAIRPRGNVKTLFKTLLNVISSFVNRPISC